MRGLVGSVLVLGDMVLISGRMFPKGQRPQMASPTIIVNPYTETRSPHTLVLGPIGGVWTSCLESRFFCTSVGDSLR